MLNGFKYIDDLDGVFRAVFGHGSAAVDAAKLTALSQHMRGFLGGIERVTAADFNRWYDDALKNAEFGDILARPGVRNLLSNYSTRAIRTQNSRIDFLAVIDQRLARGQSVDIDALRGAHGLRANDPVIEAARLNIAQKQEQAARAAASATPDPAAVTPPPAAGAADNLDDAARRTATGAGDEATGTADNLDDAARRTATGTGDEAAGAADNVDEAARGAGDAGTGAKTKRPYTRDNPGPHGQVDGRIMPVNFEHWTHRLAAFAPSSIFRNIPILKAFSLGSLKLGLPNIAALDYFIRPAVAHLDNTIKSTGVMDAVNTLQVELGTIVRRLRDPSAGTEALDAAKANLDGVLRNFAEAHGAKLDEAIVQVDRLLAEVADGASTLPKYSGKTGLTPNQARTMTEWLEDMKATLTGLRSVDGEVGYSKYYQDEITRIFTGRRSNKDKADTLENILNSRFNRLGRDVTMRQNGVILDAEGQAMRDAKNAERLAVPMPHRLQGLERQLLGGNYNQYDRAEGIVGDNINNVELAMFQMLEHYKFRKPGDDSVEATNKFVGWINEFYHTGTEADANRTIRVLIAEMGGAARETYPKGLLQRIDDQILPAARSSGDLHRETFWRNIRASLLEIKDRPTDMGPREVERIFYAPFAKFWLIATGYPMPKSWEHNLLTGFSVPTTDRYLRYPITNQIKRAWAYMTGGHTLPPPARMEGELVIDAAHSVRKFKYDWLPRFGAAADGKPTTNFSLNGLVGRGSERSLFGVLGTDGLLDRMPWYMKMPMHLASGGMFSTQSRVGLTLPGKVLVGGAGVAWGVEQGTAALGWGNEDGRPGWQSSFDPRGAINTLQRAGLSIYDGVWDFAVPTATLGNVRLDIDRGMPFSDLSIRNWILSWTQTSQDPETQRIGADLRAKADDAFNGLVADYGNIKNLDTATAQLMQRLQQEAVAARQRNETEKAEKLDQLYRNLQARATAISAFSMGADSLQLQSREALAAFQRSTGPLEARSAVTALEQYRTQIGTAHTQARTAHNELRAQIQAVPEAAAILSGTAVPAPLTGEQIRAETERQGAAAPAAAPPAASAPAAAPPAASAPAAAPPAASAPAAAPPAATAPGATAPPYIGLTGGSTSTTTGTPDQQLTAIKAEAARAVRESQQSVAAAAANVQAINTTIREIREMQEYARNNNGNPAYFDNALAEIERFAQEATIASQAAVEANAQLGPLATDVNAATTANVADARTKMERMTPHARVARESQNRAARAHQDMQRFLEGNRELDRMLHERRQTQRVENITGALDGGNNGLLSNLTRSRGQPGGESFLGQMFNAAGNAFAGVRDWWTRDVARAASRSEGGKMMYQAANIGLGGLAALLAISTWNSTLGRLTGTQIGGGLKLLIVGGVLLYMLRGSSAVGDTLDKMGGRYSFTANDYNMGSGSNGTNPFASNTSGTRTADGGQPASANITAGGANFVPTSAGTGPVGASDERMYPGQDRGTRVVAHNDRDVVFREFAGGPRAEALVGQSEAAAFAPDQAERAYGRVVAVSHSQDTSDRSTILEFGRGNQGLQPALV